MILLIVDRGNFDLIYTLFLMDSEISIKKCDFLSKNFEIGNKFVV